MKDDGFINWYYFGKRHVCFIRNLDATSLFNRQGRLKFKFQTALFLSLKLTNTMKFFSHFYLENHMYFNDYLKYVLIFAALVVLLFAVSQYLRHRMDTKYRDLSIIALLLLILICGIQYLSYSERQNFAADTSRMVGFLNALIENQKVKKQDIIVNSTHLSNGMIVGIKNQYYEVHFNQDFSAYTLTPINLVNNNIELIDKE